MSQRTKTAEIVALGELLVDFLETRCDDEGFPTLVSQAGGAPANMLASAAACGRSTAMIAKVGDDAFGKLLAKTLRAHGVSTESVIVDGSAFTTLAFVTLDDHGDRSFSFARKPGADTLLAPEELDVNVISQASIFHFGTLSMTDEPARSATKTAVACARKAGALISFDPNYRPALWPDEQSARAAMEWGFDQADIVKISDQEAAFHGWNDPEKVASALLNQTGALLVFITCGAAGCLAATPHFRVWQRCPFPVVVRDTTGAGDIFTGAALSALLDAGGLEELTERKLSEIVRFATTMASLSTEFHGGMASIPDAAAVRRELEKHAH